MSDARFRVIFAGEARGQGEANVAAVKQAMIEKFKLPAAQVEQLFSGRRAVLKNGLDAAGAERFAQAFAQIGAIVTVEPMSASDAPAPSMAASTPPPMPPTTPAAPPVPSAPRELALEPTEPEAPSLSLSPESAAQITPRGAPDLGGIAAGPAPNAAADPYAPPATADLLVAPQDDGSTAHPPKRVGIGRGWGWIADAMRLFGRAPGVWIGIVVIGLVLLMMLSMIPFLNIFASLLMPVLAGGLMVGTHRLAMGGELEINDLFGGFKNRFGSLVLVGLAYLLGALLIGGIVFAAALGAGSYMSVLLDDPEALRSMGENWEVVVLTGFVVTALVMPLIGMTWFAPTLIAVHNVPLGRALGWSMLASLKNMLPFLLFSIMMTVLMIMAMIPVFLGLLVIGPVLVATVYTSYRDIFME